MPRAAAAQGKLEKEDVDVRKGFLLAVALVAFLFPSGAGAAEKVWSNSVPDSVYLSFAYRFLNRHTFADTVLLA